MNLEYKALTSENFLIAGPCVIENINLLHEVAKKLVELRERHNILVIFKSSFDKANRTSLSSFRGPGLEDGIEMLKEIKETYSLPITTDVHEPWHCEKVKDVIDIIQIPAFLCRQTDLLVSAAKTGNIINIKKAQFLDGKDMQYAIRKVEEIGNRNILLTERGTMFGLGNLVVDFRQVIDMQKFGYPIIMDATHSCQKPGSLEGRSGGNREYALPFVKMAKSIGVNGFFIETHPNPEIALSDGPNMQYLESLETDFIPVIK